MTGGDYAVQRRESLAGSILDFFTILMFPFMGIKEIGEEK